MTMSGWKSPGGLFEPELWGRRLTDSYHRTRQKRRLIWTFPNRHSYHPSPSFLKRPYKNLKQRRAKSRYSQKTMAGFLNLTATFVTTHTCVHCKTHARSGASHTHVFAGLLSSSSWTIQKRLKLFGSSNWMESTGFHWQREMLSLGTLWWCRHHSLPFLYLSIIYHFIPEQGRLSPDACPWTAGGSCGTDAKGTCKPHEKVPWLRGDLDLCSFSPFLLTGCLKIIFFYFFLVVCMPGTGLSI